MKSFFNRISLCFISCCVIILLLIGCAQETAPTGGPKDTQPPIALKSKPMNRQTHFSDKSISITFDEFVVLKDAASQILISPPILPKPTYSTKGKSVIVNLKDSELLPNTTYNIFFGDAIQDLHESNVIPDFHYVFSTGSTVDSLSFSGKMVNAFDNSALDGIVIMLYRDDNDTIPLDSLPYKVLPDYVCRSQNNGAFQFSNLKDDHYKIFALKDENRNFLYDLPEELIAFCDTLIEPIYVKEPDIFDSIPVGDSTVVDVKADSTDASALHRDEPVFNLEMLMFKEVDSTVRLNEVKVMDSVQARFYFSFSTKDPVFKLLQPGSVALDSAWMFQEWSKTKDTLTAWFPSLISDTLKIEVSNDSQIIDTVTVALKQPPKPRKKDKKEMKSDTTLPVSLPPSPLIIFSNASGIFPFYYNLTFSFLAPLTKWDFDHVIFTVNQDTVATPPIIYHKETRRAFVDYSFKEQTRYSFEIAKDACCDILGLVNDTTKISFTTDESSKYGTLKMNIQLPEDSPSVIIQLLSEDGKKILQEKFLQESQTVDFGYLSPQKVKIKAIFDANANRKWDSGNYFWKIQPERTCMFEKTIDIRAYWDAEENWTIEF